MITERNSDTLQGTGATLNQVNDNVRALDASHQTILQAVEQLSDIVQHDSGLSLAQSKTLNATCSKILELVERYLPGKPQHSSAESSRCRSISSRGPKNSDEKVVKPNSHQDPSDNTGLQHALDRLSHLSKEKEKTLFYEEAETILRDVEHIYELLLAAEEMGCVEDEMIKRSREHCESDVKNDRTHYRHEANRIKGLLGTSRSIAINEKGEYEADHGFPSSMVLQAGCSHRVWCSFLWSPIC